jgi:hypothetical protein
MNGATVILASVRFNYVMRATMTLRGEYSVVESAQKQT